MFKYDLMKYPVTINSNRIYEKSDIIDTMIKEFNRAKFYTYNLFFLKETDSSKFKDKYGEESIYNIVKDKFKFDVYCFYLYNVIQYNKMIYQKGG